MEKEQFLKIISDAVEGEIQAQDCYLSLSQRTSDPKVAAFFEKLSNEEKGHRDFLRKILEKQEATLSDTNLPDISVPNIEDDVTYSEDMSYEAAVTMSIKNEEYSENLYQLLADTNTDPETVKLFTSLSKHEASHKADLTKLLETTN